MEEKNYIYTVTLIKNLQTENLVKGWRYTFEEKRVAGFFTSLDKALQLIEDNFKDISKSGTYQHVVLEKYEEGLWSFDTEPKWYKWSSYGNYTSIEDPVRHILRWAFD